MKTFRRPLIIKALVFSLACNISSGCAAVSNEEAIIRKLRSVDSSAVQERPGGRYIQLEEIERESLDDLCPLIAQLSSVTAVDLEGSPVSAVGLRALAPLTDVKKLQIIRTGLKGRDLELVEHWTKLEELYCGPFVDGDEAFRHIGKFTNLKSLSLKRVTFSPKGLKELSGLKQLEKLNCYSCEDVPDLSGLGELTALKAVDFFQSQFSDAAIRSIPSLSELTSFGLAYCQVTDELMPDLEKHPHLVKADLRYTKITNEGFARLNHPERWERLFLHELKLDDGVLPSLARMKNLQWLDFDETDISEAGFHWLEQQLPNCRIDWEPRQAE